MNVASSVLQKVQVGTVTINAGTKQVPVPIRTGTAVYVLGRNGTGKSALVHNIVGQLPRAIYIPGSRPSYFDNDSLQLTPAARRQMESSWLQWDRQPHTRYRPINGTQRNERAILDLQSGETQFKVDAANEIKAYGASAGAIARLQSEQSPFDRVNALMRQANLPTQILMSGGELLAQRQGSPYSIAKMSDGERAALIMAADVVSAPSASVFLIDEPELHLHRSIVFPLIAALLRERPDCAFVKLTAF
jgi:ATPase subunit of ABC transporter with duplicated ATPase domains